MSRCSDIGKYAMEGSNRRVCSNGEWSGQRPVCFGLNQENDYARKKDATAKRLPVSNTAVVRSLFIHFFDDDHFY